MTAPPGAPGAAQGAAPADLGPSNATHWLLPVGRSWQSLLAGYVGLACLLFAMAGYVGVIVGLLTIGLGVWALVVARKGGHGSGRAIFAIIAGVIAIAGGFATVSWWS